MILFLLILLGFNTPDLSISDPRVEIIQSEKDNVFYAVYFKANEEAKVDTLCGYGYAVKLQDFHINEDSTISLIIESNFGAITYEVFKLSKKTGKFTETDFYPIGNNQRLTRGFKSGSEDINPKYQIISKENIVKLNVTGDVINKVDLEKIKAMGFSSHTKSEN